MQSSLTSRFRGTLLGAALGEVLGENVQQRGPKLRSPDWFTVDRWGFASKGTPDQSWMQLTLKVAQALTLNHRWQSDALPQRVPDSPQQAGLAIATLPLALYYHDDITQLRSHLSALFPSEHGISETRLGIEAITSTLSLALHEKLVPSLLIDQLLSELDLPIDLLFTQQMIQVRDLLLSTACSANAIRQLRALPPGKTLATAIALYCFLSTPEDPRLSILKAARLGYLPSLTCALVGALSGCYNGLEDLPLHWRRSLATTTGASGTATERNSQVIADQLLVSWSGIVQPAESQVSALAIAAPRVIRPR